MGKLKRPRKQLCRALKTIKIKTNYVTKRNENVMKSMKNRKKCDKDNDVDEVDDDDEVN